jgi:outer membrane cobalamin receptor
MSVVPNLPRFRILRFVFVLMIAIPALLRAQQPTHIPDSLRASGDTIRVHQRDSLATTRADSAGTMPDSVFRPLFPHAAGSFDHKMPGGAVIGADSMEWYGARYLGDIISWVPGVFPVEQSSEGQYSQPAFGGNDWRSTSVAADGRSMIDPATSLFNFYYAAPMYYEQVEIVSGPRAFLYGLQGTGAAINLVTRNLTSYHPLTHLVYSEGPDGFGLIDFVYSQNVTRRFNATFGVLRQGTDGIYPNSSDVSWNVRVKLRYHLSRTLAVILSDYFTSTNTGLNGGINYDKSGSENAFSPRSATLMNTDSYEKVHRHDLDATFIGTFLGDSVNVSKLTVFTSMSLREYRDEENRVDPNGITIHSDHQSSWTGAQFTQELSLGPMGFSFGVEAQERQIEGSPNLGRQRQVAASAWAKLDLTPVQAFRLSFFGRTERFLGESYFGIGADASWRVLPSVSLFGGVSVADRPPNYFELYWTDSTVVRNSTPGAEHYVRAEAGVEFRLKEAFNLRGTVFYQNVSDLILLLPYQPDRFVFPGVSISQGGSERTVGFEGWLAWKISPILLEISGTALFQEDGSGNRLDRYPRGAGKAGLFFRDHLFSNHLDLKLGVQGRVSSAYRGDLYNPEAAVFVRNESTGINTSGSIDLVLIGHLGDAYVHFLWENPFGIKYFSEPYYAGFPSGIRFGISWTFFD